MVRTTRDQLLLELDHLVLYTLQSIFGCLLRCSHAAACGCPCQHSLLLKLLLHLYSHLAGKLLPEYYVLAVLHHLVGVVGLLKVTVEVEVHLLRNFPQPWQ
jgi:hypothetical protein